jgi:adenine C2-methylase RlmN of 23S rRNA A2503 and tRNA A37
VLIPIVRRAGGRPRTTLCVSSQVGCGMNCQFCLTGRLGLRAQLSAAQIVEQARPLPALGGAKPCPPGRSQALAARAAHALHARAAQARAAVVEAPAQQS